MKATKKSQKGLSFLPMMLMTALIIMSLVYLRGVAGIIVNNYKISQILSNIIKQNPNAKDDVYKKIFAEKLRFENTNHAVSVDKLSIEKNEKNEVTLTVEYQHCEDVVSSWYICDDVKIIKK